VTIVNRTGIKPAVIYYLKIVVEKLKTNIKRYTKAYHGAEAPVRGQQLKTTDRAGARLLEKQAVERVRGQQLKTADRANARLLEKQAAERVRGQRLKTADRAGARLLEKQAAGLNAGVQHKK